MPFNMKAGIEMCYRDKNKYAGSTTYQDTRWVTKMGTGPVLLASIPPSREETLAPSMPHLFLKEILK